MYEPLLSSSASYSNFNQSWRGIITEVIGLDVCACVEGGGGGGGGGTGDSYIRMHEPVLQTPVLAFFFQAIHVEVGAISITNIIQKMQTT